MKKNKKVLIISLIIITFIIVIFIIAKPFYDSQVFDNIGKEEILQQLQNIEDSEKQQKEIEEAIKKGWITEEDAKKVRIH